MKGHEWGSDNLRREISYYTIGANNAQIDFVNGSWIKVVTASDNARGNRANILIIDEFRMVKLDVIKTVLKRFLTAARQPGYLNNPEYKHLLEENKEIYMSSAWFQNHWSYDKARAFFSAMLDNTKQYFICSLPYQVSLKEGLLSRNQIQDEMSESDFDEMKFQMEMQSLFYGDTKGSFFSFEDIDKRRKLKDALYNPALVPNKSYKIPDLVPNERRILSVDVALMASKTHKNDASAIIVNRAIPTNNDNYTANIVHMENHEGLNTNELALTVRKLYKEYKCTDLVLDTSGQGLGVYDELIRDIIDPTTGELYEALSCRNDRAMADRCKVSRAPEVIWSIKGNASFNSEICLSLRSGFKQGKINLLISEQEAEELLRSKLKGFNKLSADIQVMYKMPYIQTGLLVKEITQLEYEHKGQNIKIKERTGMRKDRYSSLAYNYWVQCQLEREMLQNAKSSFSLQDYANKFRNINKRPTMY